MIEDRAFEDGKLVERTLDYFAQADDGTVHYLGEHVNNIRRGRVVNHNGTWLYGSTRTCSAWPCRRARKLGDQWRLEDVPGITTSQTGWRRRACAPGSGGKLYTDVIRTQEFIQPEGEVEYKLYAPGVGVITEYPPDGRAVLHHCVSR